jgi:hypothetical protein
MLICGQQSARFVHQIRISASSLCNKEHFLLEFSGFFGSFPATIPAMRQAQTARQSAQVGFPLENPCS